MKTADELYTPDFVLHDWTGDSNDGLCGFKEGVSVLRAAYPTGGRTKLTAPLPAAQARLNRSWSITLVHAATKSFANFSFESAHA